jgi:hypothetical protein
MNAFPHRMPMAVLPDSKWYLRAWVFHHENGLSLLVTHNGYGDSPPRLSIWSLTLSPVPIAFSITSGSQDYEISGKGVARFLDYSNEIGVLMPIKIRDDPATRLTIKLLHPKRAPGEELSGPKNKKRRFPTKGKA